MHSNTKTAGKIRPGGRTTKVRLAVAEAVLEFIRNGELDFSYNQLAEISGIHKTTLYRRWPQRIDLLSEAIELHNQSYQFPRGDNWHDDAIALINNTAQFLANPIEIAINSALLSGLDSATNPIAHEYWRPIQEALNDVVIAAQQRGELPPHLNPSTVIATLTTPILLECAITREQVSDQLIHELIKIAHCYSLPPTP